MIDLGQFTEDALVEQPAIELFKELKWEHLNCYHETFGAGGTLGREAMSDVVLVDRLRPALETLNPDLPADAINQAIEELRRDRSAMSLAAANQEVYELLKDGVKVTIEDPKVGQVPETVKVIDWAEPSNNDFFLASQLWVSGPVYKRRADLVGFVNGLPLVFVELKASHKRLKEAYDNNLRDYKDTIGQLFWYNGVIVLSNGSQSRIGSITSQWEHFGEWKRINDEGEQGVVSLETIIRGTCDRTRLLDIVENFTLFQQTSGGLIKIIAKNHQYLGVNKAIEAVKQMGRNQGRLGVFWHTQGSGKSFSMIFFSRKIHRKLPGNWTFVIVTDRDALDSQIYKNFADTGAVTEPEDRVRASSGEHLKTLLQEDHRYVFTLIQKFHAPRGETYPTLSDRSDVIVMTDEAHRSQYDILAMNMRNALPQSAFIGFTATPLIKGEEERTREVFGDYVSVYDFRRSVEDNATVPLYYENRIPEMQLTNKDLNEDMERLLEEAELDEEQEKRLEKEFAREYHLITRDDRLDKIAEDAVRHFVQRGEKGKAMFVAIDRYTAVTMYDRVQAEWAKHLVALKEQLAGADEFDQQRLAGLVEFMEQTDMAVVISQSQNEVADFKDKGLDIAPHRQRIVKEDLETKFKDPDDPLRLVFVCAMWLTGFDVPSCSTIYLDKPMKDHTLMQALARANRVFGEKVNGLIVDYVGVFRNLQKALAIYGTVGTAGGEKRPVAEKAELIEAFTSVVEETTQFLADQSVSVADILASEGLERVKLLDDAVEAIVGSDETKRRFESLAAWVRRLYRAILPDAAANRFVAEVTLFKVLVEKIRSLREPVDISEVMKQVEELLDRSVAADAYRIETAESGQSKLLDLSQLDFEALRKHFATSRKRMELERLRAAVEEKLMIMVQLNKSRLDFQEKFQELIDEYNAGATSADELFEKLLAFVKDLDEEEQRHVREQVSEEELALLDILLKPRLEITKKEETQVKGVAQELLATLKNKLIVLDWRNRQQARAAVRVCIQDVLDRLPRAFTPEVYQAKCDAVYQHVFDCYTGPDQGVYAAA